MPLSERTERVRTTVRLPRSLYEEARKLVERELVSAETINDFFVAAILAYVKLLRRKQMDADFARRAEDADYQKEARLIAEEFSTSDWETFQMAEKDDLGD